MSQEVHSIMATLVESCNYYYVKHVGRYVVQTGHGWHIVMTTFGTGVVTCKKHHEQRQELERGMR